MRAIVTGMNGTVAPVLARQLGSRGVSVTAWDRRQVSIEDRAAMAAFIAEVNPGWFFHVATGSPDWTSAVAEICCARHIAFLFTSTVSVFSDRINGPFTIHIEPDARDDYGRYKRECEQRVRTACPGAIIARLGWQIGDRAGSNNMVDFMTKAAGEKGPVEMSTRWRPSCCFLEDTADALCRLMADHPPGFYHVEGNPGLSFFEIGTALNRLHGGHWTIVPTTTPDWDNRMVDDRLPVRPITTRLESPRVS